MEQSTREQSAAHGLSDLEMRILDFEATPWQRGTKADGIAELFELPASRYYELLNGILDKDGAVHYAPLLVKRLRRLREARVSSR